MVLSQRNRSSRISPQKAFCRNAPSRKQSGPITSSSCVSQKHLRVVHACSRIIFDARARNIGTCSPWKSRKDRRQVGRQGNKVSFISMVPSASFVIQTIRWLVTPYFRASVPPPLEQCRHLWSIENSSLVHRSSS